MEVPKTDVCLLLVRPVAAYSVEERLPQAFRCAWLGGSGAHDAVHVLQMLTGPNPHIAQSRGDEDNAVELMSPFQLLLSFCIDRGQKHLEVSWVVVWSCSH